MKKKTLSNEKLGNRIVEWFAAHPKDSYNYLQISQELGIFGHTNRADVYTNQEARPNPHQQR